ncbi:hypothetical protein SSPIM334S_06423 [Streptomyces spiroverticillatus]
MHQADDGIQAAPVHGEAGQAGRPGGVRDVLGGGKHVQCGDLHARGHHVLGGQLRQERYSHTDLVDFKANVEGAEKAYTLLKPITSKTDPKLTESLDKQFAALNKLLDKHRPNTSSYEFTSYDKVSKADRKELSDGVNALAEPLSKLAAAVTK